MRHSKAGQVFTDFVMETFRLNGRLLRAGDEIARPLHLTSARWQVLGAIEDQPLSVAQIAHRMGLARQNVQRLADVLEKKGVVDFAPNPKHARAKLVCLTTKGRNAVQELNQRQAQWANRIASSVQTGDLEAALKTMKKLRERVESG
jgi:DNA-binding MarR family transcriptional regulator